MIFSTINQKFFDELSDNEDQKIDLKENDTLQVPLTNGDTVEYSLVGTIQSIGSVDSGHFVSHVKVSTDKFIVVDDDSALKYAT